jgi:glycosyltransferase involved in cell wall biosynthesis
VHLSFLIQNAYGVGGTVRTTANLARALAERHDVEIVSVLRHRERPAFDPGPRVVLRALADLREDVPGQVRDDPEHALPSRRCPRADAYWAKYSALTDRRVAEHLRTTRADALIATRPALCAQLAGAGAGHGPVRVGQVHVPLAAHSRALRLTLRDVHPRLDALVTVSEADARAHREWLGRSGPRIEAIPNAVPAPRVAAADGSGKLVVAAGRLVPLKRYDLLLEAFAPVAARHPDWGLRLYGAGPERARLRARIDALGLSGHAHLMGAVDDLEPAWAQGSLAVSTSRVEAFGMSVVEAMRCGLPVVATDCPHGPSEIIADGEDGRLVPVDDLPALTAALLELVGDDALRLRMGRRALERAARFDPGPVAARHEALLEDLVTARRARRAPSVRARAAYHHVRGTAFRRAHAAWARLRPA